MPIDVTDPALAAKLAAARDTAEVWSPDGELLGQFVPRSQMKLPELDEAKIAEYERMRTDPNAKWYTPEQVMERLRGLRKCSP